MEFSVAQCKAQFGGIFSFRSWSVQSLQVKYNSQGAGRGYIIIIIIFF